ncbi:hypothetical protein CDAR_105571 [Caerostris darwini]|uniref:Ycf15 n=1 Tax=Caerostris darwini TaxID=1538125 RepID=A0AAV4MZU3_9ARAC|nr:hypothetical protein CDAR_105571 [Caerostris darwini]
MSYIFLSKIASPGNRIYSSQKREELWREELSCISFFRMSSSSFLFGGGSRTPSISSLKEETIESPRILTIPRSRKGRRTSGQYIKLYDKHHISPFL